eukprot:TRINITY_DN5239_c0_g1_i1.p1 TRINITY_DN5239_c0_g1~~TRINITY_DN5239_c0_g1_i1.p1  ORF type:complete len:151 (-),score=22.02 TRINITY_DN5239_c0_g1_i1:209-661(-)
MNVSGAVSFAKLSEFIKSVFKKLPGKYNLTYKDSDGDTICLFNDSDLKILLESGVSKVKLEIQECSEEFYDETQEIKLEAPKISETEPVKEEKQDILDSSAISNTQSIEDSISEKLTKMFPNLVSQIKEEIMTESRLNSSIPKIKEEEIK